MTPGGGPGGDAMPPWALVREPVGGPDPGAVAGPRAIIRVERM